MPSDRPLFAQITEQIEDSIVDGALPPESQVPSTNELAAFHRINPATAAKGIGQLVADGSIDKRRGIGMFVSPGARERIIERRRAAFAETYVEPLLAEAQRLGLTTADLIEIVKNGATQ